MRAPTLSHLLPFRRHQGCTLTRRPNSPESICIQKDSTRIAVRCRISSFRSGKMRDLTRSENSKHAGDSPCLAVLPTCGCQGPSGQFGHIFWLRAGLAHGSMGGGEDLRCVVRKTLPVPLNGRGEAAWWREAAALCQRTWDLQPFGGAPEERLVSGSGASQPRPLGRDAVRQQSPVPLPESRSGLLYAPGPL